MRLSLNAFRRAILFSCILLFYLNNLTLAQAWDPVSGSFYTNAGSVGIGTNNFSARLHIADGFGGEQLRISRGIGSVRFVQTSDKNDLFLYNKDASNLYTFWREDGNVGIGTNNPTEKLTVSGNLQLNGVAFPKLQIYNRLMLQMTNTPENNYTRSFVGQNIDWNSATNKWRLHDLTYTDFAFMRFENGGVIGFYNKPANSEAEITNTEMDAFRRLTINENGHVGIGNTGTTPDLLTVNAGSTRRGITIASDGDIDAYSDLQFKVANNSSIPAGSPTVWNLSHRKDGYFSGTTSGQGSLEFYADKKGGGYLAPLCFKSNGDIVLASSKNASAGNVLIGKNSQTNTSYKLDVNGNVRANKIVVNTTGADFVFEEDYKLRELDEVEWYIREHKHLPEIQPAKEMEAEGQDVGTLNIKLLQKVEELTLYIIAQNKEIQELKRRLK
jgi:hypothetical protein